MTARCNEIVSVIGLLEATDTSQTSVLNQQNYNFPSNAVSIKAIEFDGWPVRPLSYTEWQSEKAGNQQMYGYPPRFWVNWNRTIIFIPIPNVAGKTITIYYEKEHAFIDNQTQTTIDIPSVLHARMLDGVLADMYGKDLNQAMLQFYEKKWDTIHIPAFYSYKARIKNRGRAAIVMDADSNAGTDHGIV